VFAKSFPNWAKSLILRVIKQERFGIAKFPQRDDWLGTPGGKAPQAPHFVAIPVSQQRNGL